MSNCCLEVLFAGLKNNNYRGNKPNKHENSRCRQRCQGAAGTAPGSGCSAEPNPPNCGVSPLLSRPEGGFSTWPVKLLAGQRSPFPPLSPPLPKIGFIPRITPQNTRSRLGGDFPRCQQNRARGRRGIFISQKKFFSNFPTF